MVPAEDGHDATREIEEPIISAGKILDVLVPHEGDQIGSSELEHGSVEDLGSPVSVLSEAKDLGRFGEGTVHKKGVELFDDCTKTGLEIIRFGEDTVDKKGVELFDDCTKTGTDIKRFLAYVQEKAKVYGVTSTADEDSRIFILDSGCSFHVVCDPAYPSNRRDPPGGMDHFEAAEGSCMVIKGYGDIVKDRLKIPDVYLVDGVKMNLISVGQIGNNHKVWSCFAGDECKLTRNGIEVGQAVRREDNLYIITTLEI